MSQVTPEHASYPIAERHEELVERAGIPLFKNAPLVYEPDLAQIEAANAGEYVGEEEAFASYFERMRAHDPAYVDQIEGIVALREEYFPEAVASAGQRTTQFVVPAYREGENMEAFLEQIRRQFDDKPGGDWGITIVMDHAIPYRNPAETRARLAMQDQVSAFLEANPQYRTHIDYVFYTRRQHPETPVLPVGMARKVGEDVLMMERLKAAQEGRPAQRPLYLGLMDMDTGNLTPGLLDEMAALVPDSLEEKAKVIRVKGSFDAADVAENLHLHPLQVFWEGCTSEVGRNTRYNPFNIGRLSAVPARELAMTGGGFAQKRPFPDEDIRHGIQIKWNLDGIETAEAVGRYSTSARREVNTMNAVLRMIEDKGGVFDKETMEVAALIRMYGNWASNTYRRELGNVGDNGSGSGDPLQDPESFSQAVPPQFIETLANANYRFTQFVMYAVDELATAEDAPEIMALRDAFLKGDIAHFQVELETLSALRTIYATDRERFSRIMPLLERADTRARTSIATLLEEQGIRYWFEETPPLYGIFEDLDQPGVDPDRVVLAAPFKIDPDQSEYMARVREELMARM